MKITPKFNFAQGDFDTDKGEIECVAHSKYNLVELCFKAGMLIPFAEIELSSDDYRRGEVFEDAEKLGNEICRRWNDAIPQLSKEKKKVIIEITDKGWTTTVKLNGKVYKERHAIVGKASTECVEGDLESEKDLSEDIIDAICGLSSFYTMLALSEIE